MKVTSSAVKDGYLDVIYGIDTPNQDEVKYGIPQRSFPFEWGQAPEGTVTFAVVFEDFDNIEDEGVHWVHWLVSDIPASRTGLEENEADSPELIQGKTGWALPYAPYDVIPDEYVARFGGPAPGRRHEYELTVYALDCTMDLPQGFTYNVLRNKMQGHILEQDTLKFYYGK